MNASVQVHTGCVVDVDTPGLGQCRAYLFALCWAAGSPPLTLIQDHDITQQEEGIILALQHRVTAIHACSGSAEAHDHP